METFMLLEYKGLVLILQAMEGEEHQILNKGMTYVELCKDLFGKGSGGPVWTWGYRGALLQLFEVTAFTAKPRGRDEITKREEVEWEKDGTEPW